MKARLISYSQPVRHVHSGEPGIMGLENIQDLVILILILNFLIH